MKVEWNDEFRTGLEDIDAQHKYFVVLLQAMLKGVEAKAEVPALIDLASEVKRYAKYHFRSEEALLEAYESDQLTHQCQEHAKLMHELEKRLKAMGQGQESPSSFLFFLFNWFAAHTTCDDHEYAEQIKNIRKAIAFPD